MRRVCAKLAWLTRLLAEFGVSKITPIPLKCDNMVAIHIATNSIYHERTEHVEVDCHYVRQQLQAGLISLSHVPTTSQKAKVFTKSLLPTQHLEAISNLRLV